MASENGDCLETESIVDHSARDERQSLFPVFWAEMSLGTASATTQVAVEHVKNAYTRCKLLRA
jgi:hypothetical protein